jgi:hypothetical protein
MHPRSSSPIASVLSNTALRRILAAVVVAAGGFVLLNLTFLSYALFHWLVRTGLRLGPESAPPAWVFVVFLAIIGLASVFVFRSGLPRLAKATFAVVPVAVVLAMVGISLNRWPPLVYAVGAVCVSGSLLYLRLTRQSWVYYYAILLVALGLAIFTLAGGDI